MRRYELRSDDAGRLVRRLRREMGSLWVFLNESGVEPTNNRAERALRFGVLWRKGSLGTASASGVDDAVLDRWRSAYSIVPPLRIHVKALVPKSYNVNVTTAFGRQNIQNINGLVGGRSS